MKRTSKQSARDKASARFNKKLEALQASLNKFNDELRRAGSNDDYTVVKLFVDSRALNLLESANYSLRRVLANKSYIR